MQWLLQFQVYPEQAFLHMMEHEMKFISMQPVPLAPKSNQIKGYFTTQVPMIWHTL